MHAGNGHAERQVLTGASRVKIVRRIPYPGPLPVVTPLPKRTGLLRRQPSAIPVASVRRNKKIAARLGFQRARVGPDGVGQRCREVFT